MCVSAFSLSVSRPTVCVCGEQGEKKGSQSGKAERWMAGRVMKQRSAKRRREDF